VKAWKRLVAGAVVWTAASLPSCGAPEAAPAPPASAPVAAARPPSPAPPPADATRVPDAAPPRPAEPPADDVGAFTKLGPPEHGSWRASFPDDVAMSYDDYVAGDPVRADGERRALAFLPVGPFDDRQRADLEAAVRFAAIWFDLPVRVLPDTPLTDESEQFRLRTYVAGAPPQRQYRTRWFLNELLPNSLPDDAVVLVGVTMSDIYPRDGWNFVFGEADLRRRVGVYSLVRYFPEFWGAKATPEADRLALLRTLKVVVHEIGHTFGLEHCVEYACAMNGSMSMPETDGQPLHLCPTCLRKLAWNRGFDVAARYRKLADFLDVNGFAPEAAWNRERAAHVR
jgi:archaemetzincin